MAEAAREEHLPRAAFKYCESVIYEYHPNKAKLTDLQGTLTDGRAGGARDAEGKVIMGTGAGSAGYSDQVLSRVVRLISDRELGRLERLTAAVERMYSLVTPEHRSVVHVKYWGGRDITGKQTKPGWEDRLWRLRNRELAEAVNLSLSTFDRRRREVVEMIALLLDV